MQIGILTGFTAANPAYSLVNVVRTQIEMLLEANYIPVLFVTNEFSATDGIWSGKKVQIRRLAPSKAPSNEILENLRIKANDIDIMLCHDIIFLEQNEEWSKAICLYAKEQPELRWIHWQHSRGDNKIIDRPDNSLIAYPNDGDLNHVAYINNINLNKVHYIPHVLDFDYLGWPKLAQRIIEDTNYYNVDVAGILPTRMDRQKQVEKAIRIFAGLKYAGKTVKFLVADSYATGDSFKEYKNELLELAKSLNLENDVVFLGEQYSECVYATPRPVVKALIEAGNLFIQPSNAETSSLVLMEAALAGNLIIINDDFPPIHNLYSNALRFPFGSVFKDTVYLRHDKKPNNVTRTREDEQFFWNEQARNTIVPALDNSVLSIKRQQLKDRWPSRVFNTHLKPLLVTTKKISGDPEVTAIITTLDNLSLLKRQIPILKRECGNIIVVNNGSTDGTREWLDSNPNIQAIHRENLGAGPGRNAGLNLWNNSTEYVLMLDGGILPLIGSVKALKNYLTNHLDIDVIAPEIIGCLVTNEDQADLIFEGPIPENTFVQRCLSSTGYALCRKTAWDNLRFSEEGPYGKAGWGVDDNDMAYRWNEAGVIQHNFTSEASGWKSYRRASGSFKRLYNETGIWPNQYGSIYEQRNVKCYQDWRKYHAPLYGVSAIPDSSHIIQNVPMPRFAKLVKHIHETYNNAEVISRNNTYPEVLTWLNIFALRWPWGDVAIDENGNILRRNNYPEELWSGNVIIDKMPTSSNIIIWI